MPGEWPDLPVLPLSATPIGDRIDVCRSLSDDQRARPRSVISYDSEAHADRQSRQWAARGRHRRQ